MKQIIDSRGYVGGERKRVLTPEQVLWARDAAHKGHSATSIQAALREVGIDMGAESVRRMLRGETYSNVGRQIQSGLVAPAAPEAPSLVTDAEVAASADRLREMLGEFDGPAKASPPADPADILRRLGAETQAARAASPDAWVAELQTGTNPFEEPKP